MRHEIIEFLRRTRNFLRQKFHQDNPNLPYIISIILSLIIVIVCVNLFIFLTERLESDLGGYFDRFVTDYIISFRQPWLTKILQFITDVGDLNGYLVATALTTLIFYLKFKNWRYVIQTVTVIIIASLSNIALKQVINRARPTAEHLVSVETLSYPSGHAMSAIAFYGFLIYLTYNFKMNKILKSGLIVFLALLIFTIGISRIYLGVHFPTDILGGYIAGLIWVVFCIIVFNIIDLFRKKEERKERLHSK